MYRLALSVLLAATAAFAVDIPEGAHLLLRMQNSVSSRTAEPGDYVYLRTDSPLSVDGAIVIPVGSYVQGVVARVKRAGRVKGRAEMAIRLESITLPRGTVYRITPRVASVDSGENGQAVIDDENTVRQGSSVGQDISQVVVLAGSGATIGALVSRVSGSGGVLRGAGIGAGAGAAIGLATALATRGEPLELRQGMSLDVVFDQTVTLE